MRLLRNTFVYFLAVFAVACGLCPIRSIYLDPSVGDLAAVAIEAPVLILASWLAARWMFASVFDTGALAIAGLLSLALILGGDYAGSALFFGETPAAFWADFLKPEGFITLDAFLAYGLMPILAARWSTRTI